MDEGIKSHLSDGESVIDYYFTEYWAWICTNKRVIKYKKGTNEDEQLHVIPLNKISLISHVDTGKKNRMMIYPVIAGISLFVTPILSTNLQIIYIILVGSFCLYIISKWYESGEVYYEFRSNLEQSEGKKWRLKYPDEDYIEATQFIKSVRKLT